MLITIKFECSNLAHGEVYSIQHYVIKFGSDLRQVGGFLWVLRFPPLIKTDRHDMAKILLNVALNTIILTPYCIGGSKFMDHYDHGHDCPSNLYDMSCFLSCGYTKYKGGYRSNSQIRTYIPYVLLWSL